MSGYRPPYTRKEQKKIVEYIIEKKAYYNLRGVAFWKAMEQDCIIERTWQSAKEHFIKKIFPTLHGSIYALPEDEISKIRTGFLSTNLSGQPKPATVAPGTPKKAEFNLLDISDDSDSDTRE